MSTNEARGLKLSEGGGKEGRRERSEGTVLGAKKAADALSDGFDGRAAAEGKQGLGEVEQVGGALDEKGEDEVTPEAKVAAVGFMPGRRVASSV